MSSTRTPVSAPCAVVGGLCDDLDEVVARFRAEAAEGTVRAAVGPALPEIAKRLWEAVDQLTAVAVEATGALHSSAGLRAEGYVSTKQWLLTELGMGEGDARGVLARTRAMTDECVLTWSAWNNGQITGAAAREISKGLTSVYRGTRADVRAEMPDAEAVLVELAKTRSITILKAGIEQLRAVVDADGMTQSSLDAYDDQSLSIATVGSMASLRGYLSHESHALIATALDAIIDGWYADGTLTPEQQPTGDASRDARARRSRRTHLQALALVELARRQVENALLGSHHGVRPHVTLTADIGDVLRGRPGELRVPGENDPVLIPAAAVERILCDCDLTDVLTTTLPVPPLAIDEVGADGPALVTSDDVTDVASGPLAGEDVERTGGGMEESGSSDDPVALPGLLQAALVGQGTRTAADLIAWLQRLSRTTLYVGRTRRTVSRRQRILIEVRDRHCRFPGCKVEPGRCEAHHVTYWRDGGRTDPNNLVLLCGAHHHLVHEGRWTISANPALDPGADGYWTFTPPPRRPRP